MNDRKAIGRRRALPADMQMTRGEQLEYRLLCELEINPGGQTVRALCRNAHARADDVKAALRRLRHEGCVSASRQGRTQVWTLKDFSTYRQNLRQRNPANRSSKCHVTVGRVQ